MSVFCIDKQLAADNYLAVLFGTSLLNLCTRGLKAIISANDFRVPCSSAEEDSSWARPELPRAITYIPAATLPSIAILWRWCEHDRCESSYCSQSGHLTQVQWGYGANWAWSVPIAPALDAISQQISSKFRSRCVPLSCAILNVICDLVSEAFSVNLFAENVIPKSICDRKYNRRSRWTCCYSCVLFRRDPGSKPAWYWIECP